MRHISQIKDIVLNNPYKYIVNNYQPEKIPQVESPNLSALSKHYPKDYDDEQKHKAPATPDINKIAVRVSVKRKEQESRVPAQSALSSIKAPNDYFIDDQLPKQKRILQ